MAEDAEISSLSYLGLSSSAKFVLCYIASNDDSLKLTEGLTLKKNHQNLKRGHSL